jgi:hypothetical protein
MKLYKYRDFSKACDADFQRLAMVLARQSFWCARPDTLNDPKELTWSCDYEPTPETVGLLTDLLIQVVGRSYEEARRCATIAVEIGQLETVAQPVIAGMIEQCRNDIGIVCFGTAPDNEVLWQRYGGSDAGVCIEVDVPDNHLGNSLHCVTYSDTKKAHINQLMRAFIDRNHVREIYELALLSKTSFWASEEEIRFISKKHSVAVMILGSRITRLILGNSLVPTVKQKIIQAVPMDIQVVLRSNQSGS